MENNLAQSHDFIHEDRSESDSSPNSNSKNKLILLIGPTLLILLFLILGYGIFFARSHNPKSFSTHASGLSGNTPTIERVILTNSPASSPALKQFTGDWEWVGKKVQIIPPKASGVNTPATFSLLLTENGSVINGNYCYISDNASQVDCNSGPSQVLSTIKGVLQDNTAIIEFKDYRDGEKGQAKLIYVKGKLIWELSKNTSNSLLPSYVELMKKQ